MNLALPLLGDLGTPELIIIVLVVLLLFGGKKLPEMARGTGRALRIFKAETKGLMEDDDDKATGATQGQLPPQQGPVMQQPYQQQPYQQQPYQQQPYQQPQQVVPPQPVTQQMPYDEPPRSDSDR